MPQLIVFDAYGTLFNLDRKWLGDADDSQLDELLAYIRQKQLEN